MGPREDWISDMPALARIDTNCTRVLRGRQIDCIYFIVGWDNSIYLPSLSRDNNLRSELLLIHLWSKHDKRNQWFGNSLPWHNKSPTNSQSKKYHNRNKASFVSYFYYIGSLQDSQALTERKGDKQQDAFGN